MRVAIRYGRSEFVWQACIIRFIVSEFMTNLIRKMRRVASFPRYRGFRRATISSINAWRWSCAVSRNWCNLSHEGHRVRDDLIIRDCSSTEVDGETAGVAVKGSKRRGRGENLSGLPHSSTDLQGCRCFTTPQSAARSLSIQPHTHHTCMYVRLVRTRTHTRVQTYREEHDRVFVRVQAYKHVIHSIASPILLFKTL